MMPKSPTKAAIVCLHVHQSIMMLNSLCHNVIKKNISKHSTRNRISPVIFSLIISMPIILRNEISCCNVICSEWISICRVLSAITVESLFQGKWIYHIETGRTVWFHVFSSIMRWATESFHWRHDFIICGNFLLFHSSLGVDTSILQIWETVPTQPGKCIAAG